MPSGEGSDVAQAPSSDAGVEEDLERIDATGGDLLQYRRYLFVPRDIFFQAVFSRVFIVRY